MLKVSLQKLDEIEIHYNECRKFERSYEYEING